MSDSKTTQLLRDFFDRWGDVGIRSTGAMRVNYSGVLYNVDGSSTDPEIDGLSWKELLTSNGITGNCYVTNSTPDDNSHPNFNVGGHMTTVPNGQVAVGAFSYLMPLCSWHNHKSRDGVPFKHDKTLMLRLSGYMEREIAASFTARLPSEENHAIIYPEGHVWKSANIPESLVKQIEVGSPSQNLSTRKIGIITSIKLIAKKRNSSVFRKIIRFHSSTCL